MLDCLVIGGGPAGLTAALYLARFRLSVRVIDVGEGRAIQIPRTRNQSAFPNGISGLRLLHRMRLGPAHYGIVSENGVVRQLSATRAGFSALTHGSDIQARTVLIATGADDTRPPVAEVFHTQALTAGRLRYCPVCDGFEVIDKTVAVLGSGAHGLHEVGFLRAYTSRLTLIAPYGEHKLSQDELAALQAMGVRVVAGPATAFELEPDRISVETAEGRLGFDALYPALGQVPRSGLASGLGARTTEAGRLIVDAHQRTSVAGLYAAGDVVVGLDQIGVATSEGAIAATAIRNDLAARSD